MSQKLFNNQIHTTMDYKEIKEKIEEIRTAIEKHDYQVDYEPANNIGRCFAPDGTECYVIENMDGPRSSTDFGRNSIDIAGETFCCELETGECESSYFNAILEDYEAGEGEPSAEEVIDTIIELLDTTDDFLVGEYTDVGSQITAYELMNNCVIENYYWCEDYDRPMDADDFTPIEEANDGIVELDGQKYYLVAPYGIDDDEDLYGVLVDAKPDRQGRYDIVHFLTEDGQPVAIEDCCYQFDSTNYELD